MNVTKLLERNNMQRSQALDIAQGIGIILVVIGHIINVNSYIGRVIWSFHMPLFFFISGYCYNEEKWRNNIGEIILRRAKQLLLPSIVDR